LKNNIVLITENFKLAQKLKNKLFLLRKNDSFFVLELENSLKNIKEKKPTVILFHLTKFNEDEFFDFLKKIKQTEDFLTTSVIVLCDVINDDTMCSAFELGIDEFISTKATETELTIRVIWAIQKQETNIELKTKNNILADLKILEKENYTYTENYIKSIIEKEFEKEKGSFVIIAPDINSRNKISPNNMVKIIKNSIRKNDILGFSSDFKFYLWLKNTDKKQTLNILNKIQKNISDNFTISAGYTDINEYDFKTIESITNKALANALLKNNSFVYAGKNFFEKKENTQKSNLKEIEQLLIPIFYQQQKRIEEKLFETNIKQEVYKNKGIFILKNKNGESLLTIKQIKDFFEIKIEHKIEKIDIKKQTIKIKNQSLVEAKIEDLLISFIKDFQKYTNC